MSFEYEVLTEEEAMKARDFTLLEDGEYDFEVIENSFVYSKAGNNPMIKLKLHIHHDGKDFGVFDNLIGIKSMGWKTKHFCEATGLKDAYENNTFNESLCANKEGRCLIGNVPASPKNDGSGAMYKAKNEVVDYIPIKTNSLSAKVNPFAAPTPKPVTVEVDPFIDSELPF